MWSRVLLVLAVKALAHIAAVHGSTESTDIPESGVDRVVGASDDASPGHILHLLDTTTSSDYFPALSDGEVTVNRTKRPTKKIEFSEDDGTAEGTVAFLLEKKAETETFEMADESPWVTVDADGAVRLKRPLDYEGIGPEKKVDFWVTITDAGDGHKYEQRIIIHVRDVNDELPYFTNRPLPMQAVVPLNAPPSTPVLELQARDPDTDNDIHYFIVRDSSGGRFEVDERSGVVRTSGTDPFLLDMEYVLYVKAEDHNGRLDETRFQSTPEERLSIAGGRRAPQFCVPSYEAEIPENQEKDSDIISVRARSFANLSIRYALKGPGAETFRIGPDSGVVALAKELDYEDLHQPRVYSLVATATEDLGGFSTAAELTVRVADVNDNSPKFELPDYEARNVHEDVPIGTSVLRVHATDADSGTNAEIEYLLSDEHFIVDAAGVISNNRQLEADDEDACYEFVVTAVDKGKPAKTRNATVRVYTKNKNDEAPKFSQQVYRHNVYENAAPNTLVTTVVASDKDGDNVRYGFAGGDTVEGTSSTGNFVIDEVSGVIRLHGQATSLDRDKYELNVTATDDGSCCPGGDATLHTSTAIVVVFVTDVNDHKPVFDECESYYPEVKEGAPIGSPVIKVHATDEDKGENGFVKYSIVQEPKQGTKFTVDEETGEVFTNKVFDRKGEDGRLASVIVKATDHGKPFLEGVCSFRVEITDKNDNSTIFDRQENCTSAAMHEKNGNIKPPVFERATYIVQITEEDDRRLPKRILQVTATSGDKDKPQDIVYFLTGEGIDSDNPAKSKFDINRTTGEIYVLKPLDRDSWRGQPQFRLIVFARHQGGEGFVGYADVIVKVKDVNDNAPYFPNKVYFGTVNESGAAGMVVMTMTAVDYDDPNEGTNARITYSIKKNAVDEETGSPIFEIEPETGVIKTALCCLDRERTPDYSIQVVATDGGGLKGTGTASIRVQDINDMPPRFTKVRWFIEVDETDGSNLPETPILTVTVYDEDQTNQFQYKVVENSGYGADKFTMVSNNNGTGSLKIVQPLDYEDKLQINGFRFRIQVNDKGDNSDEDHIAYSWVIVKLRDINDNKPQFERSIIEVSVYENAEVGRSLGTFKATDPDQGGKSRVSYTIDRTSDRRRQFTINKEGTVSIQRSLDREDTPRHEVLVLAIDDGVPPKTATATLTVIVQDINDNAPMFLKDYRPVLPEHATPRKIVEVIATDADDGSKSNGPPFTFSMDPDADDLIRDSFKVRHDPKGADGDGMAVVSSLCAFDREQQKEYFIPIEIKDSGNPAMSGTSTLTVVIGDINDNKMLPGTKDILVYNYMGQAPDTEIGRVYVFDLDDWDLPDKSFYWVGPENPHFQLNKDTGMITMRHGTKDGQYHLRFSVFDRTHTQEVSANVSVTVREIPHDVVLNSGSVRISGITDEDFIRVLNDKHQRPLKSKAEMFKEIVANVLRKESDKIDIFSVQLKRRHPPITDVRFSVNGFQYYNQHSLNGLILMNRGEIERDVGVKITMVRIDECLEENGACEGSCTNSIEVSTLPYVVNANRTSLVGVRVDVSPECLCGARDFSRRESCSTTPCHNGGTCIEGQHGLTCVCPKDFEGPRCQQTTRQFKGSDWAWYQPLEMCDESHLSLEFTTSKANGTLLYNGPIAPLKPEEVEVSDFISVELESGQPRVLADFGSGTLELRVRTREGLNDGKWHRLDIFWDTKNVRVIADFCKSANVSELEDGTPPEFDKSTCQAEGSLPPPAEYLNVNTPLQLGGLKIGSGVELAHFRWQSMPHGEPLDGCIRNVVHNGKLYDLAYPGFSKYNASGCPSVEGKCHDGADKGKSGGNGSHSVESGGGAGLRCGDHGTCVTSLGEGRCECEAGWAGPHCSTKSVPTTFRQQSYVKYALSFEPNRFATSIQLRFRTRERNGELLRVSDQHDTKYGILEIRGSRLHFRYNLNSLRNEEKDLWLSKVNVDDGLWHAAKVSRYGSAAILELDGGEGRRYNETFKFDGHQWLPIDKQEGVFAGGKAEYTGIRTFKVHADYRNGCIDDIRLDGKQLPMPPVKNETQWGQATMARNVDSNCPSNEPCAHVICPQPFECVDVWNDYECACGKGQVESADGKDCMAQGECADPPCLNGGV